MQQIELLEFEQHSYEKRYMLSCVFKGRNKFLLRYNSTANDFLARSGIWVRSEERRFETD